MTRVQVTGLGDRHLVAPLPEERNTGSSAALLKTCQIWKQERLCLRSSWDASLRAQGTRRL